MPRRLLLAALALVVALVSACADDVSPAVRVGDARLSHDELISEVAAWAGSPTLLGALQAGETSTPGVPGYTSEFFGYVLSNRVSFMLHNAEFEARGYELTDAELEQVRVGLFTDPGVSAAVLDELGEPYAEQLVADVARQFRIQTELAEDYSAWAQEAFTGGDIEVSPRYGRWDEATGTVIPPEGPRPAPGSTTAAFG